jgi:hypothetical protein
VVSALDDVDVGQAVQLLLQHRVGAQAGSNSISVTWATIPARSIAASTRVAAADHGDALALEQRAVAVRAVGDALVAVLLLARHVHVRASGRRSRDHRPGAAWRRWPAHGRRGRHLGGGDQCFGALQVHDVDVVLATCCSRPAASFGPSVSLTEMKFSMAMRVEHLAAETLGDDAGADALARGVDRRRGAGRAAADDEHVEGALAASFSASRAAAPVSSLADDLLERHAPLAERLAVQEDGRHGHDLAFASTSAWNSAPSIIVWLMPGLSTLIRFSACTTSGQLWQDSEMKVSKWNSPSIALDLLDHFRLDLGRMAAGLQQRQHQRGELVAHRDAGEGDARTSPGRVDGERRLARSLPSWRAR